MSSALAIQQKTTASWSNQKFSVRKNPHENQWDEFCPELHLIDISSIAEGRKNWSKDLGIGPQCLMSSKTGIRRICHSFTMDHCARFLQLELENYYVTFVVWKDFNNRDV